MTTTLRQDREPAANGNSPPSPFDLDPPRSGARGNRLPEITVGLFLVAMFALAGTWFYTNATDRDAVLALRNPVERGHIITTDDLRVVQINTDDALNVLTRDQSGAVVGQIALNDLSPGTLITVDQVASSAPIATGEGVVGLALDPGEYPSLSMRPGDVVRVVQVPGSGDADGEETVLAEAAEVVDVTPIGVQNQLFVSLVLDTTQADSVVAAAARDRVRLVQVARG
jgi:SAF domain